MSLSHLIHSAAARQPERPAIVGDGAALSYAQLAERIDAAASLLRESPAGGGSKHRQRCFAFECRRGLRRSPRRRAAGGPPIQRG